MNDLFASLTSFAELGQEMFRIAFLVFLRVGAVMALLPGFGEHSVPQRVRLVLALAFTAVIFPAVATAFPAEISLSAALVTETVAGLLIGLGLRLFIHALEIAGAIAAQAASLSQLFGGAGPEPQPAIGNLLVIAGLALAVTNGLHVQTAELLIRSYDVLPAGRIPGAADVADWGLRQIAQAFSLGLSLAAPFVVASLIFNLALGVINRAMPQLMVAFVAAPALTWGGLALLALTAPAALALWITALHGFAVAPFVIRP